MRAEEIATKAAELVSGDRAKVHGDKHVTFDNIAALWSAWLDIRFPGGGGLAGSLTGADVAELMELLKIARRRSGEYNPDDYIDGAGYAAIAGELAKPMETMR